MFVGDTNCSGNLGSAYDFVVAMGFDNANLIGGNDVVSIGDSNLSGDNNIDGGEYSSGTDLP